MSRLGLLEQNTVVEWLKQHTLISHSSGGREVQGTGLFGSWFGLSSWLVDGCLLTLSSPGGGWEREGGGKERERAISDHFLFL